MIFDIHDIIIGVLIGIPSGLLLQLAYKKFIKWKKLQSPTEPTKQVSDYPSSSTDKKTNMYKDGPSLNVIAQDMNPWSQDGSGMTRIFMRFISEHRTICLVEEAKVDSVYPEEHTKVIPSYPEEIPSRRVRS